MPLFGVLADLIVDGRKLPRTIQSLWINLCARLKLPWLEKLRTSYTKTCCSSSLSAGKFDEGGTKFRGYRPLSCYNEKDQSGGQQPTPLLSLAMIRGLFRTALKLKGRVLKVWGIGLQ